VVAVVQILVALVGAQIQVELVVLAQAAQEVRYPGKEMPQVAGMSLLLEV
jgi:hypothetical protein